MSRDGEAYMPQELIERVLESASTDVVLVGGQALAFWMGHYGLRGPANLPAISRDVDFFTRDAANHKPLAAFARTIRGRAEILPDRAISALIGSAIAPAGDDRIYNVDLLHAVIGITREQLEANAVDVTLPDGKTRFRVMHPLDVLKSRNANLHKLVEKQDDIGQLQFALAIEVSRKFFEQELERIAQDPNLSATDKDRAAFDLIGDLQQDASDDAARKNADRYGLFLADAIPAWLISAPVFWEKQWPYLRERMSPAHAMACEDRAKMRP
jgi:hypothetical protein